MKNKKPEIRFKEFSEEWEEKELGDISEVTKLASFEFTEYIIYSEEGNIIALRGLNVKKGEIVLDEVKYIDKSDFSKLNRSKLFVGDVLLTYVGTVGELAIIPENDKYYLAPNVARIRFKNEYVPLFAIQLMGSQQFFDKTIFPLIATSSQPALSMLNVRKFILKLPSHSEQTQIGNFFKNLDSLITLHQQKYEKLVNVKKAMLEKMFPKNGAHVPEIRFKGFSGAWEEKTLGEVTFYTKGFAFKSEHFTTDGKRIIRVSDLGVDNIRNDSEKIFISDENINGLEKYKIHKNEIIITTVGSKPELIESAVGRGILVRESEVGYLNQNSLKITNSNFVNNGFVYGLLNSKDYGNHILQIQRGNANQSNITVSDLFEFKIKIPTLSEQEKIGNYFISLDNLLTLHQGELGKLKNIKKAMLEKMFV